jgi:transposase
MLRWLRLLAMGCVQKHATRCAVLPFDKDGVSGFDHRVNTKPHPPNTTQLTIKSILRFMQDFVGFLIRSVRLAAKGDRATIDVYLASPKGRRGQCSGCLRPGPCYDHLPERSWAYVPLWNIPVTLHYRPRRIHCPQCGVKVEHMPWSVGKYASSRSMMIFLATWAKRLSWKETAAIFKTSWEAVRHSVEFVVNWGLEHRSLQGVTAVGVDELHWGRGKKSANFITVIYQLNAGVRRLLWVGHKRKESTLRAGFDFLEKAHKGFLAGLHVVCSDMWKPYLNVIAQRAHAALSVLDPFHIAKQINEALDAVRRSETAGLRDAKQKAAVKRGRFTLLKRHSRVRGKARTKLRSMLKALKRTSRAWELKESFRHFWSYKCPTWAQGFLQVWTESALRSRIEPMQKVARMLRSHEELLLNYFRAKKLYTNGITEGLNNKARVSLARSYGHRSFDVLQLVMYHNLGDLPLPPHTHIF